MTSSFFSTNSSRINRRRPINKIYTVEVIDFDNDTHTYEVEAHSEDEASNIALDKAASDGIEVSYVCAYQF